jgi:molecular chaperone DnaK
MKPQSYVLGVDFGTTNSYVCKCPSDQISPDGINLQKTERDGIPSAVLYRDGKKTLVGWQALDEWGDATDKERQSYQLVTNFKPDICSNKQAQKHAEGFLKAIAILLERDHLIVDLASNEVIFGVPSEANQSYANYLSEITEQAGYGSIETKDEPIGALSYHLWKKDFSPSDARKGVLVVDFGAGTCDFAYMRRLEVRYSWGDRLLGGRLFDDLFFKWFLDENQGAAEALDRSGDEYFVHWHECREMKESFSQTMAYNRDETFRKRLGNYGIVTGMTWKSFIKRAKSYRPTPSFARYLRQVGEPAEKLLDDDEPIDLLEWFRSSLTEGLTKNKIDESEISRIILAGGSSLWPFVPDLLCEVLDIELSHILRSERPYTVIASGLAILPALQEQFHEKQKRLREGKPAFMEEVIKPLLDRRFDDVTSRIVQDTTADLYDQKIRSILTEFREAGGTIASVKDRIASAVKNSETGLREIFHKHMDTLVKALPVELQQLVSEWFESEGLHYSARLLRIKDPARLREMDVDTPDLYGEITKHISYFVMGVVAPIVANICGGAGLALIVSGPIGWIIGAIIGTLAIFMGRRAAKKWVESKNIPKWLVKLALSKKKMAKLLEECRSKFEQAVKEQITQCSEQPTQELLAKIEDSIDQEIEGLSAIDQL